MNTNPQSTFEAHGYTWTRHTPGDPNPVPSGLENDDIWILTGNHETNVGYSSLFDWGPPRGHPLNCIIGWRYAETPQPSEPATNEQEKRLESIFATIREVRDTLKNTLGYAEQDSIAIHSSVEKLEKYL